MLKTRANTSEEDVLGKLNQLPEDMIFSVIELGYKGLPDDTFFHKPGRLQLS